jgi:hypothetical protein
MRSATSFLQYSRFFSVFSVCAIFLFNAVFPAVSPNAFAWGLPKKQPSASVSTSLKNVLIIGAERHDERVLEVLRIIEGLLSASKRRDIDGFMKYYANAYISGDNLTRNELRKLILETWEQYPNMVYDSRLLEIRINGNWITVETEDTSLATNLETPVDMLKAGVPAETSLYSNASAGGTLSTRARNLMFLRKVGDAWRIDSDQSLYEDAVLRYGDVSGLAVEFSVPDKVFAGQSYTAAVQAIFPPNSVAMTSVNRSEMVYPHPKVVNAMRIIAPTQNSLERVFTANSNSRNEMVSVSLGLLQGKQVIAPNGEPAVSLGLSGVLTLVKRVNVASKAEAISNGTPEGVVMYSANGKIDFREKESTIEEEEENISE